MLSRRTDRMAKPNVVSVAARAHASNEESEEAAPMATIVDAQGYLCSQKRASNLRALWKMILG